ncbi:MAG: phage holin family protein [Firmicutes bacterium]|jgi:putative membrane protein|nr:phage holin family protein [Bacillota bacterium]MCL5063465.1 phage holin family protein [Bacillota bacterium]
MIRGLWVWAITALGLAVIAHLNIGIHATSAVSVIIAALALGLLNTFIRPILRLIAIPITFLTLGLFGWMINGLMLWLVSWLVPGFHVAGLLAAVLGSVILAIISGVMHWMVRR